MTPEVLAALVLFNTLVAEYRQQFTPDKRIFVGTQGAPEDLLGSYAWTKCVPESGVFVTQATEKIAELDEAKLRFLAAHEVAHVQLHGKLLCDAAMTPGAIISPWTRAKMEAEANEGAIEIMAKAKPRS